MIKCSKANGTGNKDFQEVLVAEDGILKELSSLEPHFPLGMECC